MRSLIDPRPTYRRVVAAVLCAAAATVPLSGQELLDLYRRHLPPTAQTSERLTYVGAQLEVLAPLHPDLPYYLLEYVTVYAREGDTPLGQDLQQGLTRYRAAFRSRRALWAQGQLDLIDASPDDPIVRDKARQIFLSLVEGAPASPSAVEHPLRVDRNLQDFYACVYLTRDAASTYDPSVEYAARRRAAEDSVRAFIAAEGDGRTIARAMAERWYLYAAPDAPGTPAYEQALAYYRSKFDDGVPRPTWLLGAVTLINGTMTVERPYASNPILSLGSAEQELSWRQTGVMVGYRHELKTVRSFLSYVGVQVSYLSVSGSRASSRWVMDRLESKTVPDESPYVSKEVRRSVTSTSMARMVITSQSTLALEVATPVMFPMPWMSVEVGVVGGWNRAMGTFDFQYDYLQSERHILPGGSAVLSYTAMGTVTEAGATVDESALMVRPVFNLIIEPLPYVMVIGKLSIGYTGVGVAAWL